MTALWLKPHVKLRLIDIIERKQQACITNWKLENFTINPPLDIHPAKVKSIVEVGKQGKFVCITFKDNIRTFLKASEVLNLIAEEEQAIGELIPKK